MASPIVLLRCLVSGLALAGAAATVSAPFDFAQGKELDAPPLPEILSRAAAFVRRVEDDFSTVIGDERYEQRLVVRAKSARGDRERRLDSEMSFVWMPLERIWLSIRTVLKVDGDRTDDSRAPLAAALGDASRARVSELRRLRDEGARFNIGSIERNFADPMLGVQVADAAVQSRFAFELAGTVRVRGESAARVSFVERSSPTFVQRGSDLADLPARGELWIGPADGVIHQTVLIVNDAELGTQASLTVTFARNAKLDRWLPLRMEESYVRQGEGGNFFIRTPGTFTENVTCVATYANYRRFETSARVVR